MKKIVADTLAKARKENPDGPIVPGQWEQVGSLRVFNALCRCIWLWNSCEGSLWSGNPYDGALSSTSGTMVYTGKGGLEDGDQCFCPNPNQVK